MNKLILNTDIQKFIKNNAYTDISSLLLKKQLFDDITQQELVSQIEAKKRCKNKLPTWYNTQEIYYPNKLNIEQTSSEITATYKAKLVAGKKLIDLTGGFGIDCFYFAKNINKVTHCEINKELSEIVTHNYKQLKCTNICTVAENGIEYLKSSTHNFDWIYIDPSRRNDLKGKVFLLTDCLPNVSENIDLLFSKSNNILIKTSPLLDITNGIKELKFVKEIHVIAVKNEVKELLFLLEKNYESEITIKTINIINNQSETFSFTPFQDCSANYSLPENYLYEPNSAILKSGGFNEVAIRYKLNKLQQHSHLYTSDELIDFPGRTFKIAETLPYSKKVLRKRFKNQKANITTRNFPKTVATIRKELQLKDGGNIYLFFTTDLNQNKIIIVCNKI